MKEGNGSISMRGRLAVCSIVVVMIAILCPTAAQCQDAYWIGGSGDWFDSGNWQSNDLPDLNQNGFINNGGAATITGARVMFTPSREQTARTAWATLGRSSSIVSRSAAPI